jgi:hypothetical protein
MPYKRTIAVIVALVALLTTTLTYTPHRAQAAPPESPAAVITWNKIARRASMQVAKQSAAHAMFSIAVTQAAVYDAVVAIKGGYQPYQVRLERQPDASLDAAVATAAHGVLLHYFPAQRADLDADYAKATAAIPDGAAETAGIAVGRAAAEGIIAGRQGDGLEADIGFTMPAPAPGVWQLPEGQAPMTPWASQLRPFMLRSPSQFRPGPPQALTSPGWAADYNEVRAVGGAESRHRTAEQTDIAQFWTTNPILQYNVAFEQIVAKRGLDATRAARLFAMGNVVGTDALIACLDAKYHYLAWRPQFAIPQGDGDGNAATAGDPAWKPLLGTPPHPEYPSGHGCLTGAEARVLTTFLGTHWIDVDLTSTAPDLLQPTRHYERASDLTREIVNARIWGGLHFRDAAVEGVVLGGKVARWTLKHHFLPER